jgi:hypothetical protein
MNLHRAARSARSEFRADWTITDEIVNGSPSQFWCMTMAESGLELFRFSCVIVHPRPFLPPRAGHLTSRPHGRFFFVGPASQAASDAFSAGLLRWSNDAAVERDKQAPATVPRRAVMDHSSADRGSDEKSSCHTVYRSFATEPEYPGRPCVGQFAGLAASSGRYLDLFCGADTPVGKQE